jgi:hypothetical protein
MVKGLFSSVAKARKRFDKRYFKHRKFAFFDMTMNIMPAFILTVTLLATSISAIAFGALGIGDPAPVVESLLGYIGFTYSIMFLMGLITLISEWKKIHTSNAKKIGYLFTFPLFMYTYIPISVIALFKRVRWEQIHHTRAKSLDEVVGKK